MRIHFPARGPIQKLILMTVLVMALTGALWAPLCSAQSPISDWQMAAGGKMAFDVATVKQNTTAPSPNALYSNFPLGPGDVYGSVGGQFRAMNFPLIAYIEFAYKVTENQEEFLLPQLPTWVGTARFDILAKAQGNPTKDQMRLMMQSLLADRFKLTVHDETRQVPVFALVMNLPGKLGPLLQQHVDDSPCPAVSRIPSPAPAAPPEIIDRRFPATCGGILWMAPSEPGRFRAGARNVSMELIASSIPGGSSGINRPVLDKTGLTGTFDFALEFAPQFEGPTTPNANFRTDPAGPTFVDALRDQLGLKLEAQTGPVDVLVIDYVQDLPAN